GRAPLPPPPAPVVKVIDFGIAKSIGGGGGRLHSATFATSHGQLLGTLAYMSPEQLAGDPAQVDVRSDIYTLGAVLEEMLTGVPAVDVGSLDLPSAIRRIEQGRPSRPARPSPFARARGIADRPGAMPRDLHLIIGKAMAREPARRYQSVTELAADVERFLE